MRKCPKCNANISDTAKFCVKCGCNIRQYEEEFVEHICPECGVKFSGGYNCPECGHNIKSDMDLLEEDDLTISLIKKEETELKVSKKSSKKNKGFNSESGFSKNDFWDADVVTENDYEFSNNLNNDNNLIELDGFFDSNDLDKLDKKIEKKKSSIDVDDFYDSDLSNASNKLDDILKQRENSELLRNFEYKEYRKNKFIITKLLNDIDTTIEIPECVVFIEKGAFKGSYVSEIILHDGLQRIGPSAFEGCKFLKKITIPKTVTRIDDKAFYNCESLLIDVPATVTVIGNDIITNTLTDINERNRIAFEIRKREMEAKEAEKQRIALEKRKEKERLEKERLLKEEKDRLERERLAKIEAERKIKEAEKLAKIEAERKIKEAEQLAKLEAARKERARLELLEAQRKERERLAKLEAERQERERQRKLEEERQKQLEIARKNKLEQERKEAERIKLLNARIDACYDEAKKGNIESQYELALYYYTGNGVTLSLDLAFEWFEKAAKKGHPEAMEKLGDCYFNGYGCKQSFSAADKWYKNSMKAKKK